MDKEPTERTERTRPPPTSYLGLKQYSSSCLDQPYKENTSPSRRSIVQIRKREFECREARSRTHQEQDKAAAFTENLGQSLNSLAYAPAPWSHREKNGKSGECTDGDDTAGGRRLARAEVTKPAKPRLVPLQKVRSKQRLRAKEDGETQDEMMVKLQAERDKSETSRGTGQSVRKAMPPAYWTGRFMGLLDRYMNEQLQQRIMKKNSPSRFGFLTNTTMDEQGNLQEEEVRRVKQALDVLWASCGNHEARESLRVSGVVKCLLPRSDSSHTSS